MRAVLFIPMIFLATTLRAQKVDSIYFHLYTDSLKKGQHNYINVDGKLSNGRWLPMTAREVEFSCATARFEGNELIIPTDFKEKTVTITVTLKANRNLVIEKKIWIKTLPDPELPSIQQIMQSPAGKKQKARRRQ